MHIFAWGPHLSGTWAVVSVFFHLDPTLMGASLFLLGASHLRNFTIFDGTGVCPPPARVA